jgi:hypothetical protein
VFDPWRFKRWLMSETMSNAYYLFHQDGKVDSRAELQQVDDGLDSFSAK